MKNRAKGPGRDPDEKRLHGRYLLWLYKMTREEIEKVERKFTQLAVDRELEADLARASAGLAQEARQGVAAFLEEWRTYIAQKESDARKLKFDDRGRVAGKYLFLTLKLEAVEAAIRRREGAKGLNRIKALYEEMCVRRILADESGRR